MCQAKCKKSLKKDLVRCNTHEIVRPFRSALDRTYYLIPVQSYCVTRFNNPLRRKTTKAAS